MPSLELGTFVSTAFVSGLCMFACVRACWRCDVRYTKQCTQHVFDTAVTHMQGDMTAPLRHAGHGPTSRGSVVDGECVDASCPCGPPTPGSHALLPTHVASRRNSVCEVMRDACILARTAASQHPPPSSCCPDRFVRL